MRRVVKTSVFWPLLLVVGLILAHVVSLNLASPKAGVHTASEIASFGRLLEAPFLLPDAMASGASGIQVQTSTSASDIFGSMVLTADTAAFGGANPLSNLKPVGGGIKTYVVKRGDTITSLAKRFGISTSTVLSANPGVSDPLKTGAKLIILPVSGIAYSVMSGDTLASIASRFGVDQGLIQKYNADLTNILSAGNGTLVLPYVTR